MRRLRLTLLKALLALSVVVAAASVVMVVRSRVTADVGTLGPYGFKSNPGKLRIWEITAHGGARVLAEIPYNMLGWAAVATALAILASIMSSDKSRHDANEAA